MGSSPWSFVRNNRVPLMCGGCTVWNGHDPGGLDKHPTDGEALILFSQNKENIERYLKGVSQKQRGHKKPFV